MEDFWIFIRSLVNGFYPTALIFIMTDFRSSRFAARAAYLVVSLISASINVGLLFMFGRTIMMQLFVLTTAVPCIITLAFLAKDKPSLLLFNFFTAVNVLYLLAIIGRLVISMRNDLIWAETLIRAFLFSIVLYMFHRFLAGPFHYLATNMKKGWHVIAVIPMLSFSMVMFLGLYPSIRTDNYPAVLMMYGLLCLVYYIIYQVFDSTYKQLTIQENERLMSAQVSFLKTQYEIQGNHLKKEEVQRHDLRHLLAGIRTLLETGKTDDALDVLNQYVNHTDQVRPSQHCANPILNSLLSYYIEKARESGIRVNLNLDIPHVLPVEATELAMVVSNMIENASIACAGLPKGQEPWISLICINSPRFLFQISNPYAGTLTLDENGLPVTDRQGHGIGMKSILAFMKKNNAIYDLDISDGVFTFRFMVQEV